MSKEREPRPPSLTELTLLTAASCTLLVLSERLQFSKFVKGKMMERAKGQCERIDENGERCDKRFNEGWMLEANHIKPEYEGGHSQPSNGEMLCQHHHLKFHEDRYNLTGDHRELWAVERIQERMEASKGGYTAEGMYMEEMRQYYESNGEHESVDENGV